MVETGERGVGKHIGDTTVPLLVALVIESPLRFAWVLPFRSNTSIAGLFFDKTPAYDARLTFELFGLLIWYTLSVSNRFYFIVGELLQTTVLFF